VAPNADPPAMRRSRTVQTLRVDPEVPKAFPSEQAVNDALRLVIQLSAIPGTRKVSAR